MADQNPLRRLEQFGQSIWLDYIRRRMITSGELQRLIDEDGLKGITSNPAIFEKAIAGSKDYDDDIRAMAGENKSVAQIYERITVADVQMAADAFKPLYNRAGRPGRLRQPGGEPAPGPGHRGHHRRGTPTLAGGEPAQHLHQGPRHRRGPARHYPPHQRGDQRQRHPAVQPHPLRAGGRGLSRRPGTAPGQRGRRCRGWPRWPASF